MNCKEWEPLLIEAARGTPQNVRLSEHLLSCEACAAQLANQRALSRGLAALARAEVRKPSAQLEAALLAQAAPRMKARRYAAWGALAAAAAIALFFLAPRPEHVVPMAASTAPKIALPVVSAPPEKAPVASAATERHVRPRRAKRAPQPQAQDVAELVAIPYAPPLAEGDRAEMVRVSMPVMTLVSWGLVAPAAVAPNRNPYTRVNADLLLGEDGIARAVRLIQ